MRKTLYQMVTEELNLPDGWDTGKTFFELGAQSIQLMKLQMNILRNLEISLTFQELFENNTIEGLQQILDQKRI